MRVIDPHHHFWLVANNAILKGPNTHFLGDIDPIRSDYTHTDFLADSRAAGVEVVKSVAIQAGYDLGPPPQESRWLQSLADAPDSGGFPHGIVGAANLADPAIEATLAAHAAVPNVRGIRQSLNRHPDNPRYNLADRDYLNDPDWLAGLALLPRYHLSLDLQLFPRQMRDAARVAHAHPDVQFILTHTGMPEQRDDDYRREWAQAIGVLAGAPNVATKISGFSTFDREWTAENIGGFVRHAIDVFGPQRCMFASNYPPSKLAIHWLDQWGAYDRLTADLSADDRRHLFHDNAAHLYRLD
jgi:predicted TIM-barrel fold metal-dependent hydrolase